MTLKVQTWHLRQALVIAGQLPEHHDDAMAVLCAAMDLVQRFMTDAEDEPKPAKKAALTVVGIRGDDCA